MSRCPRRAFTLVELLVVITVIAMLMALLFPAINSVVGGAKKTKCLHNLEELAKACKAYELNKGYLPPEWQDNVIQGSNQSQKATQVPWTGLLLGYLGRGDLAQNLRDGKIWNIYMEVLNCPANPPDNLDTGWVAYAANAGRKNGTASTTAPADWRENGVFMPLRLTGSPLPMSSKVTSDFIATRDGLDLTLLFVENGRRDVAMSAFAEGPGTSSAYWVLNQQESINTKSSGKFTSTIASTHGGGACVSMAGTATKFLSEQIDGDVLRCLFTPHGAKAKEPGSTTLSNDTYQSNPDKVIKPGDVDK